MPAVQEGNWEGQVRWEGQGGGRRRRSVGEASRGGIGGILGAGVESYGSFSPLRRTDVNFSSSLCCPGRPLLCGPDSPWKCRGARVHPRVRHGGTPQEGRAG